MVGSASGRSCSCAPGKSSFSAAVNHSSPHLRLKNSSHYYHYYSVVQKCIAGSQITIKITVKFRKFFHTLLFKPLGHFMFP